MTHTVVVTCGGGAMVHAGGVHGGGVHGGGVMLTLATPHSQVLAALPQTLTLLSFQPFLRHSPLSGTLHSSRPGVPVPPKTNRNASKGPAVFRANYLAPPGRKGRIGVIRLLIFIRLLI